MRTVFICLLGIIITSQLQAQTLREIKEPTKKQLRASQNSETLNVIPPSPQSTIFDRYVDYPSLASSGTVEFDIPLYEITIDGLKLPISISYRGTGVKYKQYDGDIGIGWALNPGHRITRSIHGKPDELWEKPANILNEAEKREMGYFRDRYLACFAYDYPQDNRPLSEDSKIFDGQYDQFRYSLPSGNGHFILTDRQKGVAEIIEGNNDKIHMMMNDWDKIRVIDESGFNYHFGTGTDGNITIERSDSYNSAWLLKDIESTTGKNIRFKYIKTNVFNVDMNKQVFTMYDYITHMYENMSGIPMPGTMDLGAYNYIADMSFVEEINTEKEIIKFIRSELSTTNISNNKYAQLEEIQIFEKNTKRLIKKVKFNRIRKGEHWLLSEVSIEDNISETVQKYRFEYNENAVNNTYSLYADQWGFYHPGGIGLDFTPYFHKEFEQDKFKKHSLYNDFVKYEFPDRSLFSDRSSNMNAPDYYTLKKIHFPTGGWRSYEYESHKYGSSQGIIDGGGIRVTKVTSFDGINETLTRLYRYGNNEDGIGYSSIDVNKKLFGEESTYIEYKMVGWNADYDPGMMRRYSTEIIGEGSLDQFTVSYPEITIYDYDNKQDKYNGKIVEKYEIVNPYEFDYDQFYWLPIADFISNGNTGLYINSYKPGNYNLLTSRDVYTSLSSGFKLLSKDSLQYQSTPQNSFGGINIKQKVFTNMFSVNEQEPTPNTLCNPYVYVNSFFAYSPYTIITGRNNILVGKINKLYTSDGIVETTTLYDYNSLNQLIKTITSQSDGSSITEEIKYPTDFISTPVYQEMVNRNMISPIIEESVKKGTQEVKRNRTDFFIVPGTNNFILPASLSQSFQGKDLSPEVTFDLYDSKGNLRQYATLNDGIKTVYLWGYNYQYPIAEIKNATYEQVKSVVSEFSLNAIAEKLELTTSDVTTLNRLRTSLPNALVTTYTYKPLYGIETITDPRGVVTTYEYDSFGRLKNVKNHNKALIETYDYHYQNQ